MTRDIHFPLQFKGDGTITKATSPPDSKHWTTYSAQSWQKNLFVLIISNFSLDQTVYSCTTWESQCFHSCRFSYLFCPSFVSTMVQAHLSWLPAVSSLSRHYTAPPHQVRTFPPWRQVPLLQCRSPWTAAESVPSQGLPWSQSQPMWRSRSHRSPLHAIPDELGQRTWLPGLWGGVLIRGSHTGKESIIITLSEPLSTPVDTPWSSIYFHDYRCSHGFKMDHRKSTEGDGSAATDIFCPRYQGLNPLEGLLREALEMFLCSSPLQRKRTR